MNTEPLNRDLEFLKYHNSVAKTFEFLGRVGDISAYVNTKHEPIEKLREAITIPNCSGQGDKFLFISKCGGLIFVDYALIKPEYVSRHDLYHCDTDDKKVAKYAANYIFAVMIRRENVIGFDKEAEYFQISSRK